MELVQQEHLPNGYLVSMYRRENSPKNVVRVSYSGEVAQFDYYDANDAEIAFSVERDYYLRKRVKLRG